MNQIMEKVKVTSIDQIKVGSVLNVISDDSKLSMYGVPVLKIIKMFDNYGVLHGHEILLDKGRNLYFNFGMYLKGESWVKEVYLLNDPMEASIEYFRQLCVIDNSAQMTVTKVFYILTQIKKANS